jgi:Secretion system C-terminal sorting domain
LSIANIQANMMNGDFTGVKIGDVDLNAEPNELVSSDERSVGTLFIDADDRTVVAGETFTVNFTPSQKAAFQFTLNLNGLEVAEIMPGAGMTADNFAVLDNAITTSVDNGTPFAVTFRAVKAGEISNMLNINSRITKAVAFPLSLGEGQGEVLDVAIRFNGKNGIVTGNEFELFQNTPNPAKGATQIAFNLPAAGEATLTISNVEGRVVKVISGNYAKGFNTVNVNATELEAGVLFYQITSGDFTAVKKMVVVK